MRNNNERIFITGPGGVGKSTYAKEIAKEKQIPYICLDSLKYSREGKLSEEEFKKRLKKTVFKESWVMEGILRDSQEIIFPRATMIIILEASRLTCTLRALIRTIKRILGIEESFVYNELQQLFTKDFIVLSVWREYPRYIREIQDALKNTPHNNAEIVRRRI